MWVKVPVNSSEKFEIIYRNGLASHICGINLFEYKDDFTLILYAQDHKYYVDIRNELSKIGFNSIGSNPDLALHAHVINIYRDGFIDVLKQILFIATSVEPTINEISDEIILSAEWAFNKEKQTRQSLTILRNIMMNFSLADRLEIVKHKPEKLKELLNSLSDRLLNDLPPLDEDNEVDAACERIIELMQNDAQFNANMNIIFPKCDEFDNIDNLKYFLENKRFKYHFLHTHTDEYKAEHIHILHQVLEVVGIKDVPTELDEDTAELLRKKLFQKRAEGGPPALSVNVALLILAKYWPLNSEDYITLEKIEPARRVFTTSGHQFDLPKLMENHQIRDVRYKDGFETAEDKKLLNPIPNDEFDPFDTDHIFQLANNKPKFDRHDPLRFIYRYSHLKRIMEIENELSIIDRNYTGIRSERLARINPADQQRLICNIKKHSGKKNWMGGEIEANEFSSGFGALLSRGLSIEQFAEFDTEKQEALALSTPDAWQLIDHGVDAKKLFQLNASNMNALFNGIANYHTTLLKVTQKDTSTIEKINTQISELLASQKASNTNRRSIDYVD